MFKAITLQVGEPRMKSIFSWSASAFALAMITAISAGAQKLPHSRLRVLHSFGGAGDGFAPLDGLTRDPQGNFYGPTLYGGASGYGTIFKLDTAGKETVLLSFNGYNGALPVSRLVQDSGGNLYGTTFVGGNPQYCSGSGCGVVFKLDPNGNETVLHAFTGSGGDGALAVR